MTERYEDTVAGQGEEFARQCRLLGAAIIEAFIPAFAALATAARELCRAFAELRPLELCSRCLRPNWAQGRIDPDICEDCEDDLTLRGWAVLIGFSLAVIGLVLILTAAS